MTTRPRPCPVLLFAAVLIGLGFAGCAYNPTPAARAASFAAYDAKTIAGQPAREYLAERVAFLISGTQVSVSPSDPTAFSLAPGNSVGVACATAVDRRGYFLTAGHVVGAADLQLILPDGHGHLQVAPVRVVWRGKKQDIDLAIVQAPVRMADAFQWTAAYDVGQSVLAAGLNYDVLPGPTVRNLAGGDFAGKIVQVIEAPERNPPAEIIEHNAPGHAGDSGGPLVAPDGGLIGINTGDTGTLRFGLEERTLPLVHRKERALRPDLVWLRKTIDLDTVDHPPAG